MEGRRRRVSKYALISSRRLRTSNNISPVNLIARDYFILFSQANEARFEAKCTGCSRRRSDRKAGERRGQKLWSKDVFARLFPLFPFDLAFCLDMGAGRSRFCVEETGAKTEHNCEIQLLTQNSPLHRFVLFGVSSGESHGSVNCQLVGISAFSHATGRTLPSHCDINKHCLRH